MQKEQIIDLYPPLIGMLLDITQVPDPVFADKLVGDGVAIDPLYNKIYAPIDGVVKSVHPAKHAIIISADAGVDILIHIGLETVGLNGNGFNIHISDGDWVRRGDIIGEFDMDYIAQCAKTLITPIILLDLDKDLFDFVVVRQNETKFDFPIIQIRKKLIVNSDMDEQSQIRDLIKSASIRISNPYGIHARPAAAISSIARKYDSEVLIKKDYKLVNAKSIISLLGLAVNQNDIVYIYAANDEIIENLSEVLGHSYDNRAVEDEHKNLVSSKHIKDGKYYGIAGSFGAASGVLIKRRTVDFIIEENTDNVLFEKKRFYEALNTVKSDIEYNLINLTGTDQIYSGILEAHVQILRDPDLVLESLNIINSKKSAAFAINQVIDKHCKLLAKSGNSLLVDRQDDLKDLRNRILSAMNVLEAPSQNYESPTILLADELTPTDLIRLDKNIVGLISITGGATSHAAIIARARGIPLLVGVHPSILEVSDNILVVLNCKDGYVNLAPTPAEIDDVNLYLDALKHVHDLDVKNAGFNAKTVDGHQVDCHINITTTVTSCELKENGSSGIGLFRTEFIYFDRDSVPTIEEQYRIYADIAANIGDAPFIIRTLDAGGDKQINYLKLPYEQNPVLGVRGIRLCLERRDLLVDQLTAIARVNKSNIKIMLPMISCIEEYRVVKQIFNVIKEKNGITVDIELGIMVEVPSVVLMSSVFAKEVAFFSIGTNDLSQYILAIDRGNSRLATQIDHLHPAVIRSIDMVVKGAQLFNRPVSVCGLMASEKLAIPLLIGLGIDQLSMSINMIAQNKAFIRSLNYASCVEAAQHCLGLSTNTQVREHLLEKFINVLN